MRQMLKTTTAMITSLSLAMPVPGFAQDATTEALLCLDGTEVPCLPGKEPVDANGVPVEGTTMTKKQIAKRRAELRAEKKAAAAGDDAAAATEEDADAAGSAGGRTAQSDQPADAAEQGERRGDRDW